GAQDAVDPAEVEAWFHQERAHASEIFDLHGLQFRYAIEHRDIPSKESLEQMRAAVVGRPDHPLRRDIETFDRRLRNGPDVTECSVWLDSDLWRWNRTFGFGNGPEFIDIAAGDGVTWSLSPDQLNIADRGAAPPGYAYDESITTIRRDLGQLLNGSIGIGVDSEAEITDFSVSKDRWRCRIERGPEWAVVLEGHWSAQSGRGFVDILRYQQNRSSDYVGATIEFLSWRFESKENRWIAGEVVERDRTGRSTRVLVFRNVAGQDTIDVSTLVKPPVLGEPDPVRGFVRVSRVEDHRKKIGQEISIGSDGNITDRRPTVYGKSSRVVRLVGWTVLVALICGFVGLRLYRGKQKEI
ncbi:MAG: hypothetical protein DRJ50_14490, partial [Actinobacteria bacterium]